MPKPMEIEGNLQAQSASRIYSTEHPVRIALLRQALDELPDVERQIVVLFYATNFSLQEIGAEQGLSCLAVSTRLRQALEILQTRLNQECFLALSPHFTPEDLIEAILNECAPVPDPPAFRQRLRRIALYEAQNSKKRNQRALGTLLLVAGSLGAALLGAGVFWWIGG